MKKGLDKTAVVRAACELADREGTEALSLARLAALLAIKSPSLYNHVRSLADLRKEIAIVGAQELADALQEAMVGKAGKDALRAGMFEFRRYVLARPGVWKTLAQIPGNDVETDGSLRPSSQKIIRTLGAGLEAYRLEPPQVIHAIRALRSLVHGFTSLELVGGFGLPVAINESFESTVETFLSGLEARSSLDDGRR